MENVQKKTGVFIDRNGDKTMKGIKVIQVCKNSWELRKKDGQKLNIQIIQDGESSVSPPHYLSVRAIRVFEG